MAKIKSNARFTHTRAHVDAMAETIETWRSPYRKPALEFMERLSPDGLFVLLHSMRRWYSGQTMARKILAYRWALRDVMAIEPRDAVGVYRGFKVLTKDKLADAEPGDQLTLPVTRNHGFSSWSTTDAQILWWRPR